MKRIFIKNQLTEKQSIFRLLFEAFSKRKLMLLLLMFITITIPIVYLTIKYKSSIQAAWFDDTFTYRKAVAIPSHTALETNVYVTVPTFDATDTSKFQADCGDLRFTKQNGEQLPYYVVDCDATANIHVQFDTLAAGASTYFMYYGNPSAQNGFSPADFATAATGLGVQALASEEKSPGPVAYWKFDEGQGVTAQNSTWKKTGTTTNYITNPSFEVNTTGWSASSTTLTAANSIKPWVGTKYASIVGTGTGTYPRATYSFSGLADGTYAIQFRYKADSLAASTGYWYMWAFSPTLTFLAGGGGFTNTGVSDSAGWVTVKTTFTITSGLSDFQLWYYLNGNGSSTGTLLLDGIQVESGSVNNLYCDGSLIGNGSHVWNSTAHASSSTCDAGTDGEINGATWQSEDKCINGKCLYFDGSNDIVTVSNTVSGVQTVSFWVRPITTSEQFIDLNGSAYIQASSGTISATGFTSPTIYVNGIVSSTIAANKWQYVTVTTGTALSGSAIKVGQISTNYGQGFFDDIKIYNYARTAAQIKSDFASKGSGSVKGTAASLGSSAKNNDALSNGLVGYWKSDEASGNGVDSSGNGNTSTVSGSNNYGGGKFGNGFRSGVATTNLVTNPSLETGTAGGWTCWHNSGSGTCAQSSDTAAFGTKSWKSTMTVDGNQGNQTTSASVSGSTTYSVSTWVNITSWGGSNFTFYMREYYPTGNGQCGSTMYTASGVTNGWVRITGTCTTRADTTSLMVSYYLGSTSQVVYTDGVQIEQASSATPYVDGSLGTGYSWSGTAHASTSTRTASNSSVANATGLQITNQITLSGWVKYDDNTGRQYIISKGASYTLEKTTGQKFDLGIYNGSSWTHSTGTTSVTKGTWYHVVATYNGSLLNVYVNGNLDNSQTGTGSIATTTNVLALGSDVDGTSYVSDGILDETRIYNRALSGAEVSKLYSFAPGPMGYWKMDEKTGQTVNDISGNGLSATLGVNSSANTDDPTWTTGKYGAGLSFDGGDYVARGTGPTIVNTVSFWTYPTSTTNYFVDLNGSAYISATSGTLSATGFTSPTIYVNGVVSSTIQANQWQYITVTTATNLNASALNFGKISTNYLAGKLDDVKIYNYARTSKQIVEDMNAGHPLGGSPVGSQVSYWKLDEGYGTLAYDSMGRNNGTLTSSPVWSNQGKFNKALLFNGNSGYVNVGDPADGSLDFNASQSFSVTFWIKTASHTSWMLPIWKGGSSLGAQGYDFEIATNGRIDYNHSDTVVYKQVQATSYNVADDQWHHIAGVTDRTANRMYLYIDGKRVNSGTDISTLGSLASANIFYVRYPSYNINGIIDEVKVYSSALTEDEIKLDYNRGSAMVLGTLSDTSGLTGGSVASSSASSAYCIPGDTATCNPPIGEWNFEEGSGASAQDSSGGGSTGTITGATYQAGKIGKALNFNAGTDAVTVSNSLSTKTVEFWVYPSTTTQNLIDLRTDATAANISVSSGTISATGFTSPTIYVNGKISSTLSAGTWQHITITTGTAITANAIRFGRIGSTSLAGKLDLIRIFDYARTPAQIAWDYNRGGPVGWWKMDECQGGTANDSSGNGNSGTITIGATGTNTTAGTCTGSAGEAWKDGAVGKYNSSLEFDGTDDYVNVSDPASGILDFGTNNFSLSTWVKTPVKDTSSTWHSIVGKWNYSTTVGGWHLYSRSGNYRFQLGNDGACSILWGGFDKPLTENVWEHLVVTVNRTGNAILYINGAQSSQSNISGSSSCDVSNSYSLNIAARENASLIFNGQIDDVKIFNYALTPLQIKQLYNENSSIRFGPNTGSP